MSEENGTIRDNLPPRRWGRMLLIGGAVMLVLVSVVAAVYFLLVRDPRETSREHLRKAIEFAKEGKHAEAIVFYRKALQLEPDNEDIRRALAGSYLQLDELPKAITEYREYLRRKPEDRPAQLFLAGLYLRSGNVYEAKRITDDILRVSPEDITALILRAECHRRENRSELETADLEKVIRLAPGWAPAYVALADLQMVGGDPVKAEQLLRKAASASPGELEPVIKLAQFYASQNRLADAEVILLQTVEENPGRDDVRRAYADFLVFVRRYDEALVQYQQALSLEKASVPALVGCVVANIFKNDLAAARGCSERLLKVKDGRTPGLYYRGLLNLMGKKPKDAIRDLLQVAEEDANNAAVQYLLGIAYLSERDFKEAKARLGRALQIAPAFVQAQLVLADLLLATGDTAQAVAEAEEVLKTQADNVPALLIAGQGYILQRAPQKAEPYLQRVAEVEKESAFARMVLARVYLETGKQADALRACQEAIQLNPKLSIARFLLGSLHEGMGEYQQAIQEYEKAVEIEPVLPAAANNLAYAYAEYGGDLDKAQGLIEPMAAKYPKQTSFQDTLAWVLFKKEMYPEALGVLEAIPAENREQRPLIGYHYALALYKNDKVSQARAEFEKVLPQITDEAKKKEILEILSRRETRT